MRQRDAPRVHGMANAMMANTMMANAHDDLSPGSVRWETPMDEPPNDRAAPLRPTEADSAGRRAAGEVVPPTVRRTLPRAPSERYAGLESEDGSATPPTGSMRRALVVALVPGVVGGGLLVLFGSPLAIPEALVAIALALGVATGLAARRGGGSRVPLRRRKTLAVAVAVVAVFVAELVVWRLALAQGGDLGFADYQLQAFGPVAILQPIAAALAAWAAG